MAEEKKKKTPEDFRKESMESFRVKTAEGTTVKKIIGVVSGKGGVGKSLVTGLTACALNRKGYKVGVLDADITGPSIPKMFGAARINYADEKGNMIPAVSDKGIKVVSLNLLMDNETDPVIWRGPVIAGVVKQFYGETNWGDVDYMLVDMPPGTGDVPLTVFQSLPIDGIIVVSTPQELVSMIVEKAINMASMMNVPVLGLVENMSYMTCPHCNKPIYMFGESKIDSYASSKGLDVLARIPLDPEFAAKCDEGKIEDYEPDFMDSLIYRLEQI